MTVTDSHSSFGPASCSRRGFVRSSLVTGVAAAANRLTSDFLAFSETPDSGWLWINHECSNTPALEKGLTDEKVITQLLRDVGGSCLRLRRESQSGRWRPVVPSPENFRVDGLTSMLPLIGPAAGHALMDGMREVKGTLGNCGGGLSPWGTFFSGEENFYLFFGDPDFKEEPGIKVKSLQRP